MGFHHDVDEGIVGPFLNQFFGTGQPFRGRFKIGGGKIEKNLPQETAHPGLLGRFGCFLLENIHVGEGCRPRFDHLRTGQHTSPIGQFGIRISGLGGEDVVVEPLHQFHVVGDSAKAGHGRVGVGVDEAGHDDGARNINRYPTPVCGQDIFLPAQRDNRIFIDGDCTAFKFRVLVIHRQNRSAGNQDVHRFSHWRSLINHVGARNAVPAPGEGHVPSVTLIS